jgi:hypothetical protein
VSQPQISSFAAIAAAALLLLASACSADGTDDGSSEPTAPPTSSPTGPTVAPSPTATGQADRDPTPVDVPPETLAAASEAAADLLDQIADTFADPETPDLDPDVIDGDARAAIENQAAEFAENGWRTEGRARIISLEVYERTDDRLVVGACVDDSAIRVYDSDGNLVADHSGRPPTRNIYTLDARPGGWVVVGHTFPDDPDC